MTPQRRRRQGRAPSRVLTALFVLFLPLPAVSVPILDQGMAGVGAVIESPEDRSCSGIPHDHRNCVQLEANAPVPATADVVPVIAAIRSVPRCFVVRHDERIAQFLFPAPRGPPL